MLAILTPTSQCDAVSLPFARETGFSSNTESLVLKNSLVPMVSRLCRLMGTRRWHGRSDLTASAPWTVSILGPSSTRVDYASGDVQGPDGMDLRLTSTSGFPRKSTQASLSLDKYQCNEDALRGDGSHNHNDEDIHVQGENIEGLPRAKMN